MAKRFEPPSSILIAMPTWVGDAVMATPLLEALHEHYPAARKDLLIKPYLHGLLDHAPWLGEMINFSKQTGFSAVRAQLARNKYDWGILLSNSFRPALLMWRGGVRRRIGYKRNGRGILLSDRLSFPKTTPFRMIDFYGRIGDALDLPEPRRGLRLYVSDERRAEAEQLFKRHEISADAPVVGLNPGAKYGSSKLWPADYFAQTADALIEQLRVQVVLLPGPGEDELAADICASMSKPAAVLPSRDVNLDMLKAVIGRLDLLVGNDTGPRHIAAALGVATVTIFGPTHTAWGDSGFDKAIDLAIPVDCGPCMQRVCPLKHHKCMADLTPVAVIAAARELLQRSAPG